MYRAALWTLAWAFLTTAGFAADRSSYPTLFPRPKEVTWHGSAVFMPAGATAIVTGEMATEPERCAAKQLRTYVGKRFKADWPVVNEKSDLKRFRALVVVGQRSTCRMLDGLCRGWKVSLSADSPGWDGYAIQVGRTGGRIVAMIGGSTPRGVVYGQDTFFQMLKRRGGQVALAPALIRDWPSVKWRGRPHSSIPHYSRPGTWDAFAQARVNFVDLRYGGTIYGTPADAKLDKEMVNAVIREAHRRGMFVFATVDCAVLPEKYDAVIARYEEYLKMGADGIYISVDDPGADFRVGTPFALLNRIVTLGRKYGITGDRIAMVPGKESYKELTTETNRKTGQVEGLQEVLLFATTLPSMENLKKHLANGFTTPPSWWHNWPRPRGGFTHIGNSNARTDGVKPYMYLSQLSEGWRSPSLESLRGGGRFISGVMPWGGSLWGPEYVAHVISMWAWNPEDCDWDEQRARIYDIVFGPEMIGAAREFDDGLQQLEAMFVMAPDKVEGEGYAWPPILRQKNDRNKAETLLKSLDEPLVVLENGAAKGSLLDEETLRTDYLKPMRGELDIARLVLDLPCPEYWWDAHNASILRGVQIGNIDQARKWIHDARSRAVQDARRVQQMVEGKLDVTGYARRWEQKVDFSYARATRLDKAPKLIGDLSDPLWQQAAPISDFGDGEARPDDQTEVRLLYTSEALYVGFTCFESNMDKLVAKRTARGSKVWEDDAVEIRINTDGLLFPNYQFGCNVIGTQYDAAALANGAADTNWDPDWQVKTARGTARWTAEFKIPFKTISVKLLPYGCLWMCNFCRIDHANTSEEPGYYTTSSFGAEPGGSFHDTRKFRPVWFE